MRPARLVLAVLAAAGALLVLARPAAAQTSDTPLEDARSFVVLTGRLDVNEGEIFDDAVIFDGDVSVAGQVVNNVVAFDGDVIVTGRVGESVIALSGQVTLEAGAQVGGDVVSREEPKIAEGATVGGTVTSNGLPNDLGLDRYVTISRVAIWFVTSVSSLVLGLALLLFAPRAGEAVAASASARFGLSTGIGFAVFFGLPIAGVLALVTIVGIPLGVGLLLGLALLFWMGYVSAALTIGRLLVKPPTSRLLAFLAGWVILRVFAIVPGLGGFVWFLATVFGLGALTVAARRAGRFEAGVTTATAVGIPPPPPMPPA